MSAIAGWVGLHPENADALAAQFLQHLKPRAPHDTGQHIEDDAGMVYAHRNHTAPYTPGCVPSISPDGQIWAVCDGLIYDTAAIKHRLEAAGYTIHHDHPAALMPSLYCEYGEKFIDHLHGTFTVAIYDHKNRKLIIARDRVATKPLYYAAFKGGFAFASEVRALLAVPGVDTTPDRQAIADLTMMMYVPAPLTVYQGIRMVEPGEMVVVHVRGDTVQVEQRQYHRWAIAPDHNLTMDTAAEHTDALIRQAIRRQTGSDATISAYLSGGIDSSLISAVGQEELNGRLQTFNMRFAEPEFDETWAAQAVANHIGTPHTTLDITQIPSDWDEFTRLLSGIGRPVSDIVLYPLHIITRHMAQSSQIALSGTGADTAYGFGGIIQRIAPVRFVQGLPNGLQRVGWQSLSMALTPLAQVGLLRKKLPRRINELRDATDLATMLAIIFYPVTLEFQQELLRDKQFLPASRHFTQKWDYQLPANASWVEHTTAFATEVKGRVIMMNKALFVEQAVTSRTLPVYQTMLDEDFFAFGLKLPYYMQSSPKSNKLVLRELAARHIPEKVANKRKQGFAFPLENWLDDTFMHNLRETLLGTNSILPEFFEPTVYRPMVETFTSRQKYEGMYGNTLARWMTLFLSLQLALSRNDT